MAKTGRSADILPSRCERINNNNNANADGEVIDDANGEVVDDGPFDEAGDNDRSTSQPRVKRGTKTTKGEESHTTDGSESDPAINASEGETSDDAIPPAESLLREVSLETFLVFYILTTTTLATCSFHPPRFR